MVLLKVNVMEPQLRTFTLSRQRTTLTLGNGSMELDVALTILNIIRSFLPLFFTFWKRYSHPSSIVANLSKKE